MFRIKRFLVAVTLVLVGMLPGLLHPGSAGAASDVLDQSQTFGYQFQNVGGGWQTAQIFTAGKSGILDRVRVELSDYSATGPVNVSIQTVSGDIPSGFRIGVGTIPASAIPPSQHSDWVDVTITGASVASGTQYALVLSASGGQLDWHKCGLADCYSAGFLKYGLETSSGINWMNVYYDALFQTYVIPDTRDQNQTSTDTNSYSLVGGGQQVGQAFNEGWTGLLDRVRVDLANDPTTPAGNITVSIQTVTGWPSVPSGTEIGRGTIPRSAIPAAGTPGWVDVSIRDPDNNAGAPVSQSTEYALVLSTGSGQVRWYDWSNVYGGGYQVRNDGNGWSTVQDHDMTFETYVVIANTGGPPPGSAIPTSTTLASSANPSVVGQGVTYTAAVSAGGGTLPSAGSVTFMETIVGTPITGCSDLPLQAERKAVCEVAYTSVGSHTVTASYSGDGFFLGSISSPLTQDVQYGVGLRYKPRDNGKAGSTIPLKITLTNASGQNLSSAGTQVQALCVVPQGRLTCSGAPITYANESFSYQEDLGPGGGYQFNVKTTGLDVGTYELLFRASGESDSIYHADGGVIFTLDK